MRRINRSSNIIIIIIMIIIIVIQEVETSVVFIESVSLLHRARSVSRIITRALISNARRDRMYTQETNETRRTDRSSKDRHHTINAC